MAHPKSVIELTSERWRQLSPRSQSRWVERALCYWRHRGFPRIKLTVSEIRHDFSRLCELEPSFVLEGRDLRASTLALRLANYFHPHMWRLRSSRYRSPWDAFLDDEALRLCIRKALTYCHDRPPLAPNSLRRQLQALTNTASVWNFRPAVARTLMQLFSREGDAVLDFCAGFGGRLLAALSLERHYIGVEPSRDTLRGLERMSHRLSSMNLSHGRACLFRGSAEEVLPRLPSSSVSLVLTSPPYFDREHYAEGRRRGFPQYVSYEVWRDGFLRVTMEESARLLKRGGTLILNVADTSKYRIVQDTQRLAARHFVLRQIYRLRVPVRPFQRRQLGRIYRHEPVLVFERRQ